jgi:hypothetical protein
MLAAFGVSERRRERASVRKLLAATATTLGLLGGAVIGAQPAMAAGGYCEVTNPSSLEALFTCVTYSTRTVDTWVYCEQSTFPDANYMSFRREYNVSSVTAHLHSCVIGFHLTDPGWTIS